MVEEPGKGSYNETLIRSQQQQDGHDLTAIRGQMWYYDQNCFVRRPMA
jgi:hypothetical protein